MKKSRTSEFSQDSKVGRAGLSALFSTGYCGPPCGLSDLPVHVYAGRSVTVCFYGTSVTLSPGNRGYDELKSAMKELAA